MTDNQLLPKRPPFLPVKFGTVGHQGFIEIIAPEPAPFRPQTLGWFVLSGILVLSAAASLWNLVRRYRDNQYRRSALQELRGLQAQLARDRTETLTKLPLLLKRVALVVHARERVAKLWGEPWFAFLETQAPGAITASGKEALLKILAGSTADVPPSVDHELFESVRRWIRTHRRMEGPRAQP